MNAIRLAPGDNPPPITQYNKLRRIPFYRDIADNLFADYWHRRALLQFNDSQYGRDFSLLYHLKALAVKESQIRRSEVARVIGNDYKYLLATYLENNRFLTVFFSSDGKIMRTINSGGMIRTWQVDTGIPIGTQMKHEYAVLTVAFSPDGEFVLTGSGNGTARLWNSNTGEPIGTPMKHRGTIWDASFKPDGKLAISGGSDGAAQLWQTDTSKPIGTPMKHGHRVSLTVFTPDGKNVFTGSYNAGLRLWQAYTGESIGTPIRLRFGDIPTVFSSDGKTIITATSWCIYRSLLSGDNLELKSSRLLPGRWIGAYLFLNEKGDKIRVALKVTGNSIKFYTIRFDIPDAPPIEGEPSKLLKEWQKKLAFKLENGIIMPIRLPASVIKGENNKPGDR